MGTNGKLTTDGNGDGPLGPNGTSPRPYDFGTDAEVWRYFWHPVCTLDELRDAKPGGRGPLRVQLLDEHLSIVDIDGTVRAFGDRCPHRGVSLSLGWAEDDGLRCRYHGWKFAPDSGRCTEIPSLRGAQVIPARAEIGAYRCEVRYGLVWVCLDDRGGTRIPEFPAWNDTSQRCIMGEPYLWPCSSGRRVENFIDVTHFPFTHMGTLGAPPNTVFPLFPIDQRGGYLEWQSETFLAHNPGSDTYGPPTEEGARMLPPATYRVEMPLTVTLMFQWSDDFATQIWMHPTPVTATSCRSYWFTCHTEDGSSDQIHLQLQDMVLGEDLPVVSSHQPASIGALHEELSLLPDKCMILWRRWTHELLQGAAHGPNAIRPILDRVQLESEPDTEPEPAAG